ncbi:MAG: TetR family transcriptional regulator, partial [bacterium]|nr:TetR family transcriptional regulator [bacterium]
MPKIEAENVAAHRELVWGRILDAFGVEMDEHGFAELTLAGVAARAGMARSSLYTYAHDKTELMMLFVDRSVERYLTRMAAEMA